MRVSDAVLTNGRVDAAVAALAAGQHGVFARTQLPGVSRGVVDHRLRTGRWERVHRSVYRLAGAPPSWQQSLLAACLAWAPGAAVSHRAAAALWRLAGFEPEPVELTVPAARRGRGPGAVHRGMLESVDVAAIGAIPVTTPARTLLDIAGVVARDALEEALDDALRRRLASVPRVRWRLDALGRRPGATAMRALLDARTGEAIPQSVFETRLARVLATAGIRTVRQHAVRDSAGVVAVVDFAISEARVAIEADGYRWHTGRARWQHDLRRRTDLARLGWRVVHVTWEDLSTRPAEVLAAIREAQR